MKKGQLAYLCTACGVRFSRWQGACHSCGSWDSLVHSPQQQSNRPSVFDHKPRSVASDYTSTLATDTLSRAGLSSLGAPPFRPLGEETPQLRRIATGVAEFDRALGGGIVPGTVLLLGGDPGVGKSTLALQIALAINDKAAKERLINKQGSGEQGEHAGSAAVYVSGEEDRAQLSLRAQRLRVRAQGLATEQPPAALDINEEAGGSGGGQESLESYDYQGLLCTARTNIDPVLQYIRAAQNEDCGEHILLVVDSIQTMKTEDKAGNGGNGFSSPAGSLSSLRQLTESLTHFARLSGLAVLLIGHVTKEGQLAGPRQIEHMVDVVLYLEGERGQGFRLLRAVKNRFGALDEIGVFEMRASGLCGVANPSSLFLSSRASEAPGTAIFAGIEGSRPFLCEVQALVASAPPGSPRRTALGWDSARLATLLAVLEAHADLRLGNHEVYLNISGGLRVKETACDLAVACAIISAARKLPIPRGWVFCGEIGLTGDVRMVGQTRLRAAEARKLGFASMLLPKATSRARTSTAPYKKSGNTAITTTADQTSSQESSLDTRSSEDSSRDSLHFHRVARVSDLAPWLLRISVNRNEGGVR